MTIVNKYRVYCNTETAYVDESVYRDSAPTDCPNNAAHTIDTSKTQILETEGEEHPKAEDGKEFITPDLFPLGYFAVHAGCSDDVTNGTRGAGTRGKVARTTTGTTNVEQQFIDHVLLAGGSLYRVGGKIDDYVDMKVYAPATAGTNNAGEGSYDKTEIIPSSGIYRYDYVASGDGDWDLNLTEKLNSNVSFTKAVPVPNSSNTGWFNYDKNSNTLTLATGQDGAYDLYDTAMDLTAHVRKAPLLGEGKMCSTVAAVKPALVLPHWIFKISVVEGGTDHDLDVVWKLFIGRKITQ
jgi:hypothetical protein